MPDQSKPIKRTRKPSLKQAKAIKNVVANGGNVSKAMRDAGYSENTVNTPQKLTESKAYKDVLDEAGLTDTFLAKTHRELAMAASLREFTFYNTTRKETVLDDDNEEKDKTLSESVPDEVIKKTISKIKGAELLHIAVSVDRKVAYYSVPEHVARKGAVEMGYKVKGHNAPETHVHTLPKMSDKEKQELDNVLKDL